MEMAHDQLLSFINLIYGHIDSLALGLAQVSDDRDLQAQEYCI
jgi:hypothetical protein